MIVITSLRHVTKTPATAAAPDQPVPPTPSKTQAPPPAAHRALSEGTVYFLSVERYISNRLYSFVTTLIVPPHPGLLLVLAKKASGKMFLLLPLSRAASVRLKMDTRRLDARLMELDVLPVLRVVRELTHLQCTQLVVLSVQ